MSSISIKTGLGRSQKSSNGTTNKNSKSASSQTFPVFGIMVLIIVLGILGLLLFSQPASALANTSTGIAPQTLSLSGAVTNRIALEDASIQCSSTGITLNGTGPMPYTLNYAMGTKAASSNLSIDGTNTLTLSMNAGVAANIFTAYDGVVYMQNDRAYINAFLSNDAGQPLYVNATFACL